MPRYFFHTDDGAFVADNQGVELADMAAARSEAVKASGAMLQELDGHYWADPQPWRMHVTDDHNRLLLTLRFSSDEPSGEVIFIPPSG